MGEYNSTLKFPKGNGLSGKAFTEGKMIYQNGERLERNFSDLDNVAAYVYIRSFVFVPLYGYGGKKCGLLQLYNRLNGEIAKENLKEFKLLQQTLGLILENTRELNDALDYIVDARHTTKKIIEHTATDKNRESLVLFNKT